MTSLLSTLTLIPPTTVGGVYPTPAIWPSSNSSSIVRRTMSSGVNIWNGTFPTAKHSATVPSSTTGTSVISPVSTIDATTYGMAAEVTVGTPQDICTSSVYSYSTHMSVPTGYVYIRQGNSGWGPENSRWNISTGAGAKLIDMKAKCHGSSCTHMTGNQDNSGAMKQHEDGSWELIVTSNMQSSVQIFGTIVPETNDDSFPYNTSSYSSTSTSSRRRGLRRRDVQTYPLEIVGVPPCGLPVAANLSQLKTFEFSAVQWEAYRVDEFMESWLTNNSEIQSLDKMRSKAIEQFMPGVNSPDCDLSSDDFNCDLPQPVDYAQYADADFVRGLFVANAIIMFTRFLHKLIVQVGDMLVIVISQVGSIVNKFWQTGITVMKNAVLSTVSSALGIFTGVLVGLITALAPEFAWLNYVLMLFIFGANSLGFTSNFRGIKATESTDPQFEKRAQLEAEAEFITTSIQSNYRDFYKAIIGQNNLTTIIGNGKWVKEVSDVMGEQDFGQYVTSYFSKVMMAFLHTEVLEDLYLVFVPYGPNITYNGKTLGFDRETCEKRWVGDPSWKFYATCDIPFGETPGMAVVTPPSQGAETQSWVGNSLTFDNDTINGRVMIQSALTSQYERGFNYSLMNEDFTSFATKNPEDLQRFFRDAKFTDPGFFPLGVCIVTDIAEVIGVNQVVMDWLNAHGSSRYYHYNAPFSCRDFEYTAQDGTTGKFYDYATSSVQKSLNTTKRDVKGRSWGSLALLVN